MTTFFGFLRVRNEARWIERVVQALQPLCQKIFVFDDNSSDETPLLCAQLGCTVYRSPFEGIDEARDKNWLLEKIWQESPPREPGPGSQTWIIAIDGDEELEPAGPAKVRNAAVGDTHSLAFKIIYLWDTPDQIRRDGLYGRFTRGSAFRMISPLHSFRTTDRKTNFHCGSVPRQLMGMTRNCDVRLFHYGYLEKADRLRKYEFYNRLDGGNRMEDCYRHMVQGDVPEVPADAKLLHAGPLELCALDR